MSRLTNPHLNKLQARWKKLVIGGCCAVGLCTLGMLALYVLIFWGKDGEPANLAVATRVSQQFVQAIHDQQIETAYGMLSEKFSPPITLEQFEMLIRQDEMIFLTFERLMVCDWGFYISDGRVMTTSSLLQYEDGVIVVEISLHKDSDSIWRVQGFRFRPDIPPQPFGQCR